MKLLQLKAKDFRSLKDLEINFPDEQVIAIIGNNGSGKTAVLDALYMSLTQVIAFRAIDKLYIISEDDKASEFAEVELTFYNNHQVVKSKLGNKSSSNVISSISKIGGLRAYTYYASQRSYEEDVKSIEDFSKDEELHKFIRSLGFKISKLVGRDFNDWFIAESQRENEEVKNRKDFSFTLDSLNNIRTAINIFFANLEDERFGNILVKTQKNTNILDFRNIPKPEIYIQKDIFELKLSQLSAGEKMLIYLVADLAKRLTILHTNKENALNKEHLVLIDELDLNLHPSWQKSVVKALSATFPNIQFVITTHSPLILNQLKTESILLMEDGKCTPLSEKYQSFNSYGADLEDILKIVQGTENLLPKDIQQKLDEINAKLNEGAIEDAKDLIEKLKKLTDPNQPELKKAETQIQYKELLKK